jgi:hypothetical protein
LLSNTKIFLKREALRNPNIVQILIKSKNRRGFVGAVKRPHVDFIAAF